MGGFSPYLHHLHLLVLKEKVQARDPYHLSHMNTDVRDISKQRLMATDKHFPVWE